MLFCRDVVVPLTVKNFDTLFILVQNAGNVVSKGQLLEQVWAGLYVEEGSVTQNICILRRLLAEGGIPNAIETLPKRGYRFIAIVRLENKDAQILIESSPTAPSPNSVEVEGPEPEGTLGMHSVSECHPRGNDRSAGNPRMLSFGPFRNLSQDPGCDWIAEALKEMLGLEFGSGSAQLAHSGEQAGNISMNGSYLSVSGQIMVGIKVEEIATGRILETITLRKKQAELLDLIEILGKRIRTVLGI